MNKLIAVALAAGTLLAFGSGQALAWDGDGYRVRDRWYPRHHRSNHSSIVVYQAQPLVYYPPNHTARARYQTAVCATPGGQTVVVNISNANGSYTPVTLRQEGGFYVGPRGERYLRMPTEEQLAQVYGLK